MSFFDKWHVPIERARNELVEQFLNWKHDPLPTHLLFVDDDIVFETDDLDILLKTDKDVVGALYFVRDPPYQPLMLRRYDPRLGISISNEYGYMYEYEKDKVTEVDATGCGFLLIKREVFEAINNAGVYQGKWFDRIKDLSEDYSFCRRARSAGFRIHVHTGVEVGHIGKVVIDAEFARRNRWFPIDPWIDYEALK